MDVMFSVKTCKKMDEIAHRASGTDNAHLDFEDLTCDVGIT